MISLAPLAHRDRRIPWTIVGLLLLFLVGCAPELNWREVRNTNEGYQVMLPDKPSSMQRSIQLLDQNVEMAMSGAQASEVAYTIGSVGASKIDANKRQAMLQAMRDQMVRNIQGKVSLQKDVNVPILDAQARQVGVAPAQLVYADGRHPNGKGIQFRAVFGEHQGRLIQAVMLGPQINDEAAQVFFESLRWMMAPS
jgi:hypothetical protein